MGNEVDMTEVLISWLHSQATVVLTFAWSLLVAAIVSYLIITGKCNRYQVWIWKSPESAIFRKHYYTLQVAIQSPETLANKLFSRRVIDTCVKEKVHLPTLTTHEKCQILLNAVERQIKYRHERFYKFVHALQDEATTEDLSRQLIEDAARIGRYNWIKPAIKKACRFEGVIVATSTLLVMDVYLLQLNLAPCIVLGGVLLLTIIIWQYRNENDYECEEPEYPPIFSLPEHLVVRVSNYQTLQRIIAVNRIVVDCPDQELQQDEQFSPILSVVDAMTDLPINCVLLLKGEKAPEQKGYQMLLCYISVKVVIHPFDQHCHFCDPKALYHMQRSTSGHIHTNKLALRFCFFRADANYIIKFSVHCITDTEGVQYMHNTKVCECVLRIVERSQNILGIQHGETLVKDLPMVHFSGSLAGSKFQALEKLFVNSILACDSRKVEEMTRDILTAKCIGADWKAVALSYQGMAKLLVHGQLNNAEIKLTEAMNKASGLKCHNSVLLQGRFLRQKATVMRKQGKFDKAMEYIRGAKERLFNAAPSYDRSAVLYEEILLKVVCGYNETVALNREEIESIYDLVLMHASAFKDYEYQSLCMVLTAKVEFHLRSIYIRENLPAKNLKPTPQDIHKAEICLKRIIPELLPGQANVYRAHYYLAHSDLCLWKEKYTEAITWAKKAEDQFKLGKITSTNALRPQNRLKLLRELQTWKKQEEKELDDILEKYSLTVS